jgi:hypothetical protein
MYNVTDVDSVGGELADGDGEEGCAEGEAD